MIGLTHCFSLIGGLFPLSRVVVIIHSLFISSINQFVSSINQGEARAHGALHAGEAHESAAGAIAEGAEGGV